MQGDKSGSTAAPAVGSDREALAYLGAIAICEITARLGQVGLAIGLYSLALIVATNFVAWTGGSSRLLLVAVAAVVLERLFGLAASLIPIDAIEGTLLIAPPTLLAIVLAVRATRSSGRTLGFTFHPRIARYSGLGATLGFAAGFLLYGVLRPLPLISALRLDTLVVPAVVLTLATGFIEELLFRGLLQGAAIGRLGEVPGVAFGAVVYTIVAAPRADPAVVATVMVGALLFGGAALRTGSIFPGAAAHAGLNVALFLVAPFILSGGSLS